MVDAKCEAKVHLKEAKFHCFEDCNEKLCTSKMYTVVNLGCDKVIILAAKGDKIEGCDRHFVLRGGKRVTLQNFKNTFFVVA